MLCYNLRSSFQGWMGAMRCFLTIVGPLLLSVPVVAKEVTIHGFVTDTKSPTYLRLMTIR